MSAPKKKTQVELKVGDRVRVVKQYGAICPGPTGTVVKTKPLYPEDEIPIGVKFDKKPPAHPKYGGAHQNFNRAIGAWGWWFPKKGYLEKLRGKK